MNDKMLDKYKAGVEKILYQCMKITIDDDLLIVSDDELAGLGDFIFDVALSQGLHAESHRYETLPLDGMEPPAAIAEAMLNCTAAILVTSRSISHTRARREACANGARIASLPGFHEDMLLNPMMVDYKAMGELSKKIANALTKSKKARITTEAGTDLTLSVECRIAEDDTGMILNPGDFGNLPAGEAYVAPVEGSAHGTLVYDGSMSGIGLLTDPIIVKVVNGIGTEISGGYQALKLDNMLKQAGENSTNIAELGIGVNPGASITGNVLEDEKVLKTIHIALGDNAGFGGKTEAACHLDGLLKNPDLYLDDVLVMKAGEWLA